MRYEFEIWLGGKREVAGSAPSLIGALEQLRYYGIQYEEDGVPMRLVAKPESPRRPLADNTVSTREGS